MDLTVAQESQYTALIDAILQESDLATISAKRIRQLLEDKLGHDLSEQKVAIKKLIIDRFDYANTQQSAQSIPDIPSQENADEESDIDVNPPAKKQKQSYADSDAKLAALLQAEENRRSRQTRGAGNKKSTPIRKKKTSPKKKSASKIKADEDSDLDLDSDGQKKEVVRKGGFHRQYILSQPLADLVGEPQLSRPQVVKKIWEYIKARDLQDPADKRQIRCDDRMHSVFKSDRVHMFTMNKILGNQLYPVEEQ